MNERKRQAYLEAMDIQTYFPRQQLPGAKPSAVYDFSIEDAEELRQDEVPAEQDQVAGTSSQPSGTSRLDAIEELRSRQPSGRKATVTPIRQPANAVESENESVSDADTQDSLSFTLRYYRINESLAVLDEVPPQASRQMAEESLSLLRAILKALGQADFDTGQPAEEFSWPVHSAYSMKHAPKVEAAKAISGFLQMRQETDGFTNLLVFAGQVEEVLLEQDSNQVARDIKSSKGYFVTVTHSLASMLAVPTLKRDVWQHLQALRKRVAGSS